MGKIIVQSKKGSTSWLVSCQNLIKYLASMALNSPYLVQRNPIKFSTLILFFICAFGFLYFTFSSAFILPYAHHDQTRYFREDGGNPQVKNSCKHDSQYGWLYIIGRPVAAELECLITRNAHQLSDLNLFRIGTILLMAVAVVLLAGWLLSIGMRKWPALFLSCAIFTLPGAQNTVFMTNYANALAPGLAVLSYLVLSSTKGSKYRSKTILIGFLKINLAFICLIISLFTYPALSFIFIALTASNILFNKLQTWAEIRLVVIRDLFFLLVASIVYFIGVRLLLYPSRYVVVNMPSEYKVELSWAGLISKIIFFFTNIISTIFSFWNIYTIPLLSWAIIIFILLTFAISIALANKFANPIINQWESHGSALQRAIAAVTLLVIANTPWLISPAKGVQLRFLLTTTAVALLLFFWSVSYWLELASQQMFVKQLPLVASWAAILMLTGGVIANYTTTQNVWNSNIEVMFIQTKLVPYLDRPIQRIHIVRTMPTGVGYNKLLSVGDEFNAKTSDFGQDMTELVRIALLNIADRQTFMVFNCGFTQEKCLSIAPRNHILVTQTGYKEKIEETKYMVVVDMNDLVKASGISKPKVIIPPQF